MKISIVVPIYNASKYINKLIESVINQTYQDYELILVDDGSKDNSYEIIKRWEKKNNKIKAYTKKNTGPGYTRKYGFEKSTGDLIFFVDSDDWVTNNNVFQQIVDIFNKNNIDILFFDMELIFERKKFIIKGFNKISPGIHKLNEINDLVRPILGEKIFKKSILNSDMFIESKVYEDLYTTYKYLDKCSNFYYINECFYTGYTEENSKSLSSVNNGNNLNVHKKSVDVVLDIYDTLNNESLKYSLCLRMTHLFIKYIQKHKNSSNVELKKKIYKIVKILKENRTPFVSNDKKVKQFLKKVYYFIFLNIQYRRIRHEE